MSSILRAFALSVTLPFLIAANSAPQAVLPVDTIPAARDIPYSGTIRLAVDVRDVGRAIYHVRETVPVAAPGPLTLLFPAWLPGDHGPEGEIDKLAGLKIRVGSQPVEWTRDPVDIHAFHINVPGGATSIEASFDFVAANQENQGQVVTSPDLLNLEWNSVALYPAGYYVRRIPVVASVIVPSGWKTATALRPTAITGDTITFGEVMFDTLIDSPLFAGRYARADDLGHGVTLNSFATAAKQLAIPADVLAKHRAMVDQAVKTFGARHFDHYDFLNAISDQITGLGLEHHRSTQITTDPGYFIEYKDHLFDRNVFAHEFTHSWDGKFRRPEDLWTPDYRVPMRNGLLWMYEGQTQFWGNVIEARSGMSSKAEVLDKLAITAANLDNEAGRTWRPLGDTTHDEIINQRNPKPWGSWQRGEDYYNEGMLMWFEADAIIRTGTHGKRGLDDFARAFFGVRDGDWGELTYTRADIVRTLNSVYPHDWEGFFHQRIDSTSSRAPLGGLAASGYALMYSDQKGEVFKAMEKTRKSEDFSFSLGFGIHEKKLGNVLWASPAYDAGLRGGDEIVAVDGHAYNEDALNDAISGTKGTAAPIRLIIKRGEEVRTIDVRWNGGLRYPHLTKSGKAIGPLDLLLRPLRR